MLMLPTGIIYAYYALPDMWDSLYGALFAGGLMLLIFLLSRGGMGAGDVKLSFVLGVWLGFKASIVCLMLAFVFGGIIGVMLLASGIKQRKDPIPFGPFLCIGAYIALLFSPSAPVPPPQYYQPDCSLMYMICYNNQFEPALH